MRYPRTHPSSHKTTAVPSHPAPPVFRAMVPLGPAIRVLRLQTTSISIRHTPATPALRPLGIRFLCIPATQVRRLMGTRSCHIQGTQIHLLRLAFPSSLSPLPMHRRTRRRVMRRQTPRQGMVVEETRLRVVVVMHRQARHLQTAHQVGVTEAVQAAHLVLLVLVRQQLRTSHTLQDRSDRPAGQTMPLYAPS